MARQGLSPDRLHDAMLAALDGLDACAPVRDVALAVNWERPPGLANWWVGGIVFREGLLRRREVLKAEAAVWHAAAGLQSRFFAARADFVRGG